MNDLTYIDPHRRADVLKRIEAIERFNANPGRASAETEAAAINLSPSAFYTLVRAWNASRDPTKLPGLRRQARGSVIGTDALNLIRRAAEELPTARYSTIIELVTSRAQSAGIAMPRENTIREEVRRLRRGRLPGMPEGVTHALDICALNVPIASSSPCPSRAILTAVIQIDGAVIAGAELGTERFAPGDAAAAVARAIAGGALAEGDILLVDRPATAAYDALVQAVSAHGIGITGERLALEQVLADSGPLRSRGNGRAISAACGRYVAGFQVRIGTRTGAAIPKKNATPIALAEARELVLSRLGLRADGGTAYSETLASLMPRV